MVALLPPGRYLSLNDYQCPLTLSPRNRGLRDGTSRRWTGCPSTSSVPHTSVPLLGSYVIGATRTSCPGIDGQLIRLFLRRCSFIHNLSTYLFTDLGTNFRAKGLTFSVIDTRRVGGGSLVRPCRGFWGELVRLLRLRSGIVFVCAYVG